MRSGALRQNPSSIQLSAMLAEQVAPKGLSAGRGSSGADRASYLARISGEIWPPPAEVSYYRLAWSAVLRRLVSRKRDTQALAFTGEQAGTQEYLILPTANRPRLVVPVLALMAGPAVAVRASSDSAATRLAARLGSKGVQLRTSALARDRLKVAAKPEDRTLVAQLREELGDSVGLAAVSVQIGAARANRKPILQLHSATGEIVGFAKVATDELTAKLVDNEERALTELDGLLKRAEIPEVLCRTSWHGWPVLVLSALVIPRHRRRPVLSDLGDAMREVSEVTGTCSMQVGESEYLARLLERSVSVEHLDTGPRLRGCLEGVVSRVAEETVRFGAWHGDWTGWNMAATGDGLYLWDWERYGTGVPIGFDALHFRLQSAARKGDPTAAAIGLLGDAASVLADYGLGEVAARTVARLYLCELATRYLEDGQAAAGAALGNPASWLMPALEREIAP
jgi:hypothetical protein